MPIKFYQAGQSGAPTLRGQNGSLINLLDDVLVNGYGQVNVSSITRSGSTATVTTGTAHRLKTGDTVLLAGAGQAEYNGEFVIVVIDPSTFTITVTGTPATPATGTITAKRAGGGFSKVFAATNKAVYRSNDTSGLRHYFQVIDDGATTGGAREAKIRAYVSMTDVDTGDEPFPTVAQLSTGLLAYKSQTIDTTNRPWKLITDGKTFYFGASMNISPATLIDDSGYIWWFGFGELIPSRPGDLYCSFVCGNNTQNQQVINGSTNGLFSPSSRNFSQQSLGMFMPRDWNNNIGAVQPMPLGHGWDQAVAGQAVLFNFPHVQDNGFYMTPYICAQRGAMRGRFPGVFEPLQGRCLANYEIIDGIDGYPGRKFMGLWGVHGSSGTPTGMLMFDLTGPWS